MNFTTKQLPDDIDALPLYRQSAMWLRAGITFDRTTMANWMMKTGEQ